MAVHARTVFSAFKLLKLNVWLVPRQHNGRTYNLNYSKTKSLNPNYETRRGKSCWKWIFKNTNSTNGAESVVNRAIDGSTYPSKKLKLSFIFAKNIIVMKHNNLYMALVTPSSGWWRPIKFWVQFYKLLTSIICKFL